MKNNKGFTLIELIVVVAVLAIIATIAIGKYDDIQKDAARKANRANINNITSTINTYLVSETNHEGLFDYVESLIDLGADGRSWYGSAGDYDWTKNTDTDYPGIYAGLFAADPVDSVFGKSVTWPLLLHYWNIDHHRIDDPLLFGL